MSGGQTSLNQLDEAFLGCYFASRPFEARHLGVKPTCGRLPLIGQEQVDDLANEIRGLQRVAKELQEVGLTDDQRLTCRLIEETSGYELTALQAMPSRYVVSPLPEAGLTSQLLVLLPHSDLHSPGASEEFRATCAAIPALLHQSIVALETGRARGQTPVRHLVVRAAGQIQQYLDLRPVDDPYCLAAARAGDQGKDDLVRELEALVQTRIRPAFHNYVVYLRRRVLTWARGSDRAGLRWIADGEEHYAHAVRRYTTLDLSPASVHEIGLELVGSFRRETERVGKEAGLAGEFEQLCARLRGDPSLYYQDSSQMLVRARRALSSAEAMVPHWITDAPAIRCEVREMDALESDNGVLGKYQLAPLEGTLPACYWLNTSQPHRRPVYETTVLTHHESVPGHHVESTKTRDAVTSSAFRRLLRILPFYEGWCLYMEAFCDEIGLYEDAISRLGMLSFALWRSCRLVVDTGIHQRGWSRGESIRYMWSNTMLTRRNIENEVDRYIAHPGSAVGYMIGCLAIREIRDRLGVDCSNSAASRTFHTNLLRHGQLTLGRLAEAMGLPSPLEIARPSIA